MPSSRKRNKGKERKAKKDAARLGWWKNWNREGERTSCTHGCVVLPPPDHAVLRFMNSFEAKTQCGAFQIFELSEVMEKTFKLHPEVWNNDEYRQMAISILVSVGTNLILRGANEEDNYSFEAQFALGILLLESYDGGDFDGTTLRAVLKGSNVAKGGKREVLKFYSKRLPCSCLQEKYKEAKKTLPKLGRCSYCKQTKERTSLMTCGACKVPTYCSRECQVADWSGSGHKAACGVYTGARNVLRLAGNHCR